MQVQPPFEDLADKTFRLPGRWAPVLAWLLHKRPHRCSSTQLAAWSQALAAWLDSASAGLPVPDEAASAARLWMARLSAALAQAYGHVCGQSILELPSWQVRGSSQAVAVSTLLGMPAPVWRAGAGSGPSSGVLPAMMLTDCSTLVTGRRHV